MPFIVREDGERFIIPSYRDIISAKKDTLLKKEILLLSSNYGEYIALQKKNVNQYEVAFSPDAGYLLGECVWQYFDRPIDMIYCEAIPNTNEAILVIVKSGSVYLDGSFPLDSIAEELVVFKTQQNAFNIYIYGDVPISQFPEEGKISFDTGSVRSFKVLDAPVFPTLPTVKAFQLQLVDVVLRAHGIGVFPIKRALITLGAIVLLIAAYEYLTATKTITPSFIAPSNPYQGYLQQLASPDPRLQLQNLSRNILKLSSLPGWMPTSITYTPGFPAITRVSLASLGGKMQNLLDWVQLNNAGMEISKDGVYIELYSAVPNRFAPSYINSVNEVIANLVDRMSYIIQDSSVQVGAEENRRNYTVVVLKVAFNDGSPLTLAMIGDALSGLPLVLNAGEFTNNNGVLKGQLTFTALGN